MAHSPVSISSSSPFLSHSQSSSLDNSRTSHDSEESVLDDDLEASSLTSSSRRPYNEKHSNHTRTRSSSSLLSLSRRPRLLAILAILLFLVIFALFGILYVSNSGEDTVQSISVVDTQKDDQSSAYPPQVKGPPTDSFRDNLRDGTKYITAWIAAGWTNDFMTYVNLLYLAKLTNRTAVLPPFAPSHIGHAAGYVNVGDVFNLPRLAAAMDVPIIQWSDLKNPNSEVQDELGCWSIWATAAPAQDKERKPRRSIIEPHLKLDVSYTPIPSSSIMLPRPEFSHDPHTRFFSLAALTFPDGRERARLPAAAPFPAPRSGHLSLPDEQMACFDFPYYVASEAVFEFNFDWSPAWRFVGTHAHWSPWLQNVAFDAIRKTFGVEEDDEIPPFISMHVRHGDFGRYCKSEDSEGGCLAPLGSFARRVNEVREELKEKKGIEVERVLVTSDEGDPKWWDEVREMGWEWIDHEALGTEEKFGKWYTVFVDAVVQSLGEGFVGTDKSTMSLIAQRRVEDWNDGVTREVRWGPGVAGRLIRSPEST